MKVAVLFDRFGPYHVAKLTAASQFVSVLPLEIFGNSSEYKWDKVKGPSNRVTVFENKAKEEVSAATLFTALQQVMSKHKPDAVAINGWSDNGALSALYWCLKNAVPAIVMSDSTAIDEKRVWWKEYIKRKVVSYCAAGLVAGSRHVSYLSGLGMHPDAVFTGYDVIDNDYFQTQTEYIRQQETGARESLGLPHKYFLAINRFISKKNLPLLIKAYAEYRRQTLGTPHDLVVLGDGELKGELVSQINQLSLQHAVHLLGFKQYDELPYYHAFASAFIHASTSEQWGLVVNEAMASSLPVIVSERCGCVPELVKNGVNGYAFDPFDAPALTSCMLLLSDNADKMIAMGSKSREIIAAWHPDEFGKGLQKAAEKTVTASQKDFSFFDRLFLKALIFR